MNKKTIIASLLVFILTGIGISGGVYLVRQQQEIRERAAAATTIYFEPEIVTANVGKIVNLDILVDTGENYLGSVRLEIIYESAALRPTSLSFSPLLPETLRPIDLSQPGKITGSAGSGVPTVNPPISGTRQKIASLSFEILTEVPQGTMITFGANTSAYSATEDEAVGSNLIISSLPATIIVASTTGTPTLTPTPTPAVGGGEIPTSTPTPAATATPTPAGQGGGTIPTATPTPKPTATPTPIPTVTGTVTTPTPTVTLPETGSPELTLVISFLGLLVLIIGFGVFLSI